MTIWRDANGMTVMVVDHGKYPASTRSGEWYRVGNAHKVFLGEVQTVPELVSMGVDLATLDEVTAEYAEAFKTRR